MERKATVGRKPRRAQDADFALSAERAGFEPCLGRVVAQDAREVSVQFAFVLRGLRSSSRGSNPARLASSLSRNHGRAEIFALPFSALRLIALP